MRGRKRWDGDAASSIPSASSVTLVIFFAGAGIRLKGAVMAVLGLTAIADDAEV